MLEGLTCRYNLFYLGEPVFIWDPAFNRDVQYSFLMVTVDI